MVWVDPVHCWLRPIWKAKFAIGNISSYRVEHFIKGSRWIFAHQNIWKNFHLQCIFVRDKMRKDRLRDDDTLQSVLLLGSQYHHWHLHSGSVSAALGWDKMVQVWPPDMKYLEKWSTQYMKTPGNWARPETWLENTLLIFFRPHVKYRAFSLRKH